ncbi:sensor histidine kinase [Bacillus sp. FJAT-45350]|uniref:sensor histidine kinase n=1 Tax=Bacillus sp. FJAT-45350 TaxID=2011014 RepID=UPI000BB98A88|nr:HAMP domain-containing sensor histidine kinase [Bacillus sp. FJAT-45350]
MISSTNVNRRLVDFNQLLKDVISLLDKKTKGKQIELQFEKSIDLPWIKCDPIQMKQVMINLVTNSIEAIKNGGLVKVHASRNESNLLIKVIDDGIGMKEERVERLGEPYFRTHEKGTGVGLMYCFQVVKKHDGMIVIESEENKGTTVEISLPCN